MTSIFEGSLQRKLIAVVLTTTLVALIVALGAMVAYDLRAYHEGWVSDVHAQAELLGQTTAPALEFDDPQMAKNTLAVLRLQPKVRAAAIYGLRGELFATYELPGEAGRFPKLPEVDRVGVDAGDLVVSKRIVMDGRIVGSVYLRTQYELFDRVWSYAGIALLVVLFAMSVALLVSYRLQRIITRPIFAVGAAARDVIERRDYSRRVTRPDDADLAALVDAFNEMMGEIERSTSELVSSNREKEREVEERRDAQQEVMRLNDELERRVRDRTEQLEKSNGDLVLATAAAHEANRAKSDFLSNMSHELRTPLNAIIGFGQLLSSPRLGTTNLEQSKEFVNHIVQAGRHLLTLINDILNLAQIEAGKLSVSVEAVSVSEVLVECLAMTEAMAAPRNIRLLFPPPDKIRVLADRTRLKQVLLNLLSNAVKYNRDMGSVVVDSSLSSPTRVRISVRDTGIGLTDIQTKALFQPFNRLGQETGVQEGTGIGLVLTKRLVELMGGKLEVSSTVGTGTIFWIELPVAPAAPHDLEAAPPSLVPQQQAAKNPKATVLCVEDNPASVELIQALMATRKDIRLLTAANGRIGVELARAHRPDVILMDNNMPELSGRDANALLRADPATRNIPVIAISANAMPQAIADGLSAGFFRYLTKPIELPELMEAIDSAMQSSADRGSK